MAASRRLGRELGGEQLQVLRVHVGDDGVAELTLAPQQHVEASRRAAIDLLAADMLQAARWPRQPLGLEDEERDGVEPAAEHEGGRLAVHEVADGAPAEGELLVAREADAGSEVELAR